MQKITVIAAIGIFLCLLSTLTFSCAKKKKEICETANIKGRIIGYNPCRQYVDWGKVSGAGFVIEIDQGGIKDTAVFYSVPEDLFVFEPSYIDGSYSSYLFRPDVQEKFKIKFKYRYAEAGEKTLALCNGMVNTAHYDYAVKGKEVFLSCLSAR